MRILVTGATGFIGGAFVRHALERGHEIAALVRSGSQCSKPPPPNAKLTSLEGSLENPPWKEIEKFKPESCLHSAWIATPGVYLESPENYKLVDTSFSFLAGLADIGTHHLIGLGTCIEYKISGERKPLSEDTTPIEPTTTYARCKNELRLRMEEYSKKAGVKFCWGRVFYPYGPGEHPARLCSSIIQKLKRGEKVVLNTPDSTKDYIYIDDMGSAILALMEKQATSAINLGTGHGVAVREIARIIAEKLDRTDLIEEVNPPKADALGYVVAEATRLEALGWRSRTDIKTGIALVAAPDKQGRVSRAVSCCSSCLKEKG